MWKSWARNSLSLSFNQWPPIICETSTLKSAKMKSTKLWRNRYANYRKVIRNSKSILFSRLNWVDFALSDDPFIIEPSTLGWCWSKRMVSFICPVVGSILYNAELSVWTHLFSFFLPKELTFFVAFSCEYFAFAVNELSRVNTNK